MLDAVKSIDILESMSKMIIDIYGVPIEPRRNVFSPRDSDEQFEIPSISADTIVSEKSEFCIIWVVGRQEQKSSRAGNIDSDSAQPLYTVPEHESADRIVPGDLEIWG